MTYRQTIAQVNSMYASAFRDYPEGVPPEVEQRIVDWLLSNLETGQPDPPKKAA